MHLLLWCGQPTQGMLGLAVTLAGLADQCVNTEQGRQLLFNFMAMRNIFEESEVSARVSAPADADNLQSHSRQVSLGRRCYSRRGCAVTCDFVPPRVVAVTSASALACNLVLAALKASESARRALISVSCPHQLCCRYRRATSSRSRDLSSTR